MQVTIRDLMTAQPPTMAHHTTIDQALQKMLRDDVGEVFITDWSQNLIGVLPDYELLKAKLNKMPADTPVTSVMSGNVAAISPDRPVEAVIGLFRDGRCRMMAVVEDGRIIGRIERRDVLRLLTTLEQLESHESANQPGTPAEVPVAATVRGPQYIRPRQESSVSATDR